MSGYLDSGDHPHSGLLCGAFLAGAFFFQEWHVPDLLDLIYVISVFCLIKKTRGISPEVGSTKFQPVMFDMDLFGGKKVPCQIKRRTALDFGSHVP